jgi:hypothetical protein
VKVASYNEHTAALVEPVGHSLGPTGTSTAVPVSTAYSAQIRALVNDEEFSDVTFMIENLPIYAHRAILSQRSEHFAAMFRSGMRESVERVIPIPGISRQAFMLLLEYLYTDSVKIEVEHAIELYTTADLYHMDRLRDMCWYVPTWNWPQRRNFACPCTFITLACRLFLSIQQYRGASKLERRELRSLAARRIRSALPGSPRDHYDLCR